MDENENPSEPTAPITRRDLFAAAALTGLLAAGERDAAGATLSAIAHADVMIAALDGKGADGAES